MDMLGLGFELGIVRVKWQSFGVNFFVYFQYFIKLAFNGHVITLRLTLCYYMPIESQLNKILFFFSQEAIKVCK